MITYYFVGFGVKDYGLGLVTRLLRLRGLASRVHPPPIVV